MNLISKYTTENAYYFSTPEYEILVKSIYEEIPFNHALEISNIIKKMKSRGLLEGKLLVGAVPFNIRESGSLYLADHWEKRQLVFEKRQNVKGLIKISNQLVSTKYIPLPEVYEKMVEQGINYISSGLLEKIVLSRGALLEFDSEINVLQILKRLYIDNPAGYTYALKLGKSKFLIGASPEMLISKRGNFIYSNPLAGSRPRGKSETEDIQLAEELKQSQKDLQEHKIVVDNIVGNLSNVCKNIEAPDSPDTIKTKQLWHLSSVIRGKMINDTDTVLDAALAIHPTPAVCGVPQSEAYDKISMLERGSRGEFTGIIGWCDEGGDGDWAIAIRGAEIDKNKLKIQAGAGIVRDSVPKEEIRETGIKMTTILNCLDLKEI